MNIQSTKEDIRLLYEAVYDPKLRILSEEYNNAVFVQDIVENASEYFYNLGLNEDGLATVIEHLGIEAFNDFIFGFGEYELAENYENSGLYELFDMALTIQPLYESRKEALGNMIRGAVQRGVSDYSKLREIGRSAEQSNIAKGARRALGTTALGGLALLSVLGDQGEKVITRAIENHRYKNRGRYRIQGTGEKEMASGGGVVTRDRGPSSPISGPSSSGRLLPPSKYGRPDESGQGNLFDEPPKGKLSSKLGRVTAEKRPKPKRKTGQYRQVPMRFPKTRKEDFEFWLNDLICEGYDLTDYTINEMLDIYENVVSNASTIKQNSPTPNKMPLRNVFPGRRVGGGVR